MINKNLIVELKKSIETLSLQNDLIVIAIDGNSGAGKSTIAKQLSNIFECNIFHMDNFFLTPELRTQERFNEIGGNVDYVRFKKEVGQGLRIRKEFQYRIYNCQTGTFDQTITVKPKKINIVEGVYSMHPTLINLYNLKIFLSIDKEEQGRRILKRSGSELYKRYIDLWIPMEDQYFEHMGIREQSDFVY